MITNTTDFVCKIHLIISVLLVVPVAFFYGTDPIYLLDITVATTDERNFFKAIMGLYLGFSALWALGLFNASYLRMALISNMIFMLGLGAGRLLSICVDGAPTLAYVLGTIGELFLGIYGIWVLKNNKEYQ